MAAREPDHIPVQRHRLPAIHSYDVTADELDQIEREAMQVGLDFSAGSIALTACISFTITLLTVSISSDRIYIGFFSIAIISGLFTVYFGARWWIGRKRGKTVIQRIRQREVGPLGQEGRELKPGQLADLPAEEPRSSGTEQE